MVYNKSKEEIIELAVSGTRLIKELTDQHPETEWTFEYSPEVFNMAELEFARDISDAVSAVWQPTPEKKMILNLPATVEVATPNVYADQIEWMHRNIARRDAILISLHTHNDRGTAVAAVELALMAGADRVEGCLFGSGERTGNVDLITLALNLYSQGVDPQLNIEDIDEIRRCVEYCNQIPVHPRHPYVGDLVYTAFSGSHQDAIKKGMAQQKPDTIWEVPYLPLDPADVGRNYDAIIRVNSQSGKGGMAYLLEHDYGFSLPRRMQIELSKIIQVVADETGSEIKSAEVYDLFRQHYLELNTPYQYISHRMSQDSAGQGEVDIEVTMQKDGQTITVAGKGNGPIDAFSRAMKLDIQVMDYSEHALSKGSEAKAVCYIEMRVNGGATRFGVGIDDNIVTASLKAIVSGINRKEIA
jgi:2-isopropylmalate synthase